MTTVAAPPMAHFLEDPELWHVGGRPNPVQPQTVRISDMTEVERLEAAVLLLTRAVELGARYEVYTTWDRRYCGVISSPLMWMKQMPLFRALTAGLPHKRDHFRALATQADNDLDQAAVAIVGDAARLAKSGATS